MTPFALSLVTLLVVQQAYAPIDWKLVDRELGRNGTLQGEVYRVGFPRTDLQVKVGTTAVKPALALGSWVAFKQTSDSQVLLMGDLVLLETEVASVISTLQAAGIEQTAVHNHLLHESPPVIYVHVMGRGGPAALARAIHAALTKTRTPIRPPNAAAPQALGLDTLQIAQILGTNGKISGGVYQVSVPRAEPITVDGIEMLPAMGVATALNFESIGSGRAAITGDFVLDAGEVNPVIRALRAANIEVTALHSHLLNETPRLLFMHFWGEGEALSLARGLRAALDKMNVKRN